MIESRLITIALDVMGTDNGPDAIIGGGIDAAREFGPKTKICLVGRRELIEEELGQHKNVPSNVEIQHAPEEVAMADNPADAFRRKDTSIAVAFRLHKEGKVNGVVSPGNTGAVMGTALLNMGRLPEVKRPAIASFFPSIKKTTTIFLDVGANSECKPINLHQFAVMGSIMSTVVCGNPRPRIGLLSIGEEKSKGNDLIVEAHNILQEDQSLNFYGNIEGRDILKGVADVVVTDGFVGNIVLKFAESVEGFLTTSLRRQISTNLFSRAGAILMAPFLKRLRNNFDYTEYGGAPLLGINGTCIICHGESSRKAIRKALKVAHEMIQKNLNQKIEAEFKAYQPAMAASANGNAGNSR